MSFSDVPRDVYSLVLSYLPVSTVYTHCQLVCKDWYTLSSQQQVIFDLKYFGDIKRTTDKLVTILLSIGKRFPNVREIHLQQTNACDYHEILYAQLKELKCAKLEVITLLDTYGRQQILFCQDNQTIKAAGFKTNILSRFPNYRAINASTLANYNTPQKLLEYLQGMEINHMFITSNIARERLTSIIDRALPTLSNLNVELYNGHGSVQEQWNEIAHVWNLLVERMNVYKGDLHIKHIYSPYGGLSVPWEKVLERVPNLQSFVVDTLSVTQAKIFAKFAPPLTKLKISYIEPIALDILLQNLPIRSLRITEKRFAFTESANKLEDLRFSCLINFDGFENLHKLKNLYVGVSVDKIDVLIQKCPHVETVVLSDHSAKFYKKDLMKLLDGCPNLKYIHNVPSKFLVPREFGVVDVEQWREELRPKKRAKKK